MKIKSLHELDSYLWDESPVTCPKCGARTDFLEIADDMQQHECLNHKCKYEFYVGFDTEDI